LSVGRAVLADAHAGKACKLILAKADVPTVSKALEFALRMAN
jgi:hypothetical protein